MSKRVALTLNCNSGSEECAGVKICHPATQFVSAVESPRAASVVVSARPVRSFELAQLLGGEAEVIVGETGSEAGAGLGACT